MKTNILTIALLACCGMGFAASADSVITKDTAAVSPLQAAELNASIVLQVGDRDQAARQVIAQADSIGGWYLAWEEWNVTLRIPKDQLQPFLKKLESVGRKVEQGYGSADQSAELENLRASIASRRKLLDSYFSMVQSSTVSQVQVIERAIIDLIAQIELDEGRLHGMEARIQDALVQVSFRYQDRSLPAPTGKSPFAWLNNLNLSAHREAFQ